MTTLSLADAYAKFGAVATPRLHALSAIASDGAMVMSCALPYFGRPARGVLRYEDRLSREAGDSAGKQMLVEHLTRARDESLPVRMVVVADVVPPGSKQPRNIHVRPDLVGKVTAFDGDHFIVDFTRIPVPATASRRN